MIIRIVAIFIFLRISNLFVLGEYNIYDVVPSHLYRKFDNVKEDIFPEDIRIKIFLRKVIGTLLYSIDRRRNQLILSLSDEPSATLEVEFRKKSSYISIASLCGCGDCDNVVLDLVIQIRAQVYLRCNGKKPQTFPFDNVINVNKVYPIIYSQNDHITPNEAHLWLVNTPYGQGIYPNYAQLNGCIFNVWYKNEAVNFTEIIGKVDLKCPKICDDNICHGGVCIETFNGEPICNCTETFMSGKYCNDTLYSQNYTSVENTFKFTVFKLSWNSSFQEIFSLSNSYSRFRLRYYASFLVFEYNYTKEPNFLIKSILTKNYQPNKNYVCIVTFYDKFFQIQFLNNLILRHFIQFSNGHLENEEFTSISLRSGSGKIGFVYKTFIKSNVWHNIEPHNRREYVEKIEDVPDMKFNKEQRTEKNNSKYTFIVIIVVSFVVLIILVVIIVNYYIQLLRSRLIIDFGLKTWSESDKIRTFQILQQQFIEKTFKEKSENLFKKMMKRIFSTMKDIDEIINIITNAFFDTWTIKERISYFDIIEKRLKSSLQTTELLNIMIPSNIRFEFQKLKNHHDQNRGKVISCLQVIFNSQEFRTEFFNITMQVLTRIFKQEPESSTAEDKESNQIDKCMDILSNFYNNLWTDEERTQICKIFENSLKPKKVQKELLEILFGKENMSKLKFLLGT